MSASVVAAVSPVPSATAAVPTLAPSAIQKPSFVQALRVWTAGTVNLKLGVLRLFEWTRDFNIHTQRQTHTQVWMERTLYEIAGAVGTPLLIDNVTKNRLFGHYAQVLVDLDLSKDIFYEVLVEGEGFVFSIAIEYEGLPEFRTHYKSIGQNVSSSRWLHPRRAENNEHQTDKGKKPVNSQRPKHGWKPKDSHEGIGSPKAFKIPTLIPQPDARAETL
ncbi:hypothetical protein MTR_8g040870 [Medicago truncatula]|uniref:DUF4283 domain protein n=1 Tax=Medicago truncatula TaxID=3880 RepID=G7LIA5_MEDTR|nr:hypothetical protein MTR_8g040870 [Medicago truncatula]